MCVGAEGKTSDRVRPFVVDGDGDEDDAAADSSSPLVGVVDGGERKRGREGGRLRASEREKGRRGGEAASRS